MKKSRLESLAIFAAIALAWQRLGFPIFRKEYPPKSEVGHMGQAAWQLKYGGSESDYQDWLLGR